MTYATKHRSVLELQVAGRKPGDESLDGRDVPDDNVWYQEPYEAGERIGRRRRVIMDREQFEDLGCPGHITLTIEPGDLLNEAT